MMCRSARSFSFGALSCSESRPFAGDVTASGSITVGAVKQKRQRNEPLAVLHHFLNDELRQRRLAGAALTGNQDRQPVNLSAAITHQLVADPLEVRRGVMDESQPVVLVRGPPHPLQCLPGQRVRQSLQENVGSFFYRHGCNNRMEATRLYGSDFGAPASLAGRTLMISSGATPRNLASSRT